MGQIDQAVIHYRNAIRKEPNFLRAYKNLGLFLCQKGGFDEAIAVGYGDVDLCLRAGQRGYRTLFCAHAVLLHHESYTRGRSQEDPHPEDSERFLAKWRALFAAGDPYFNPNLSQHSPNWQVADPLEFKLDIQRRIFKREPGRLTQYRPFPVGLGT